MKKKEITIEDLYNLCEAGFGMLREESSVDGNNKAHKKFIKISKRLGLYEE